MDQNSQFQLEIIKKLQQFFCHMDQQCQKFLRSNNIAIPKGNGDHHKEQKVKDPDAPKKPLTPFFLFSQKYREKILDRNPEIKLTQISQIAGKKWSEMTLEDRKPYQDEYQKAKLKYDQEIQIYNEKHGIVEKKKKKSQKAEQKQFQVTDHTDGDYEDGESESVIQNPAKKIIENKQVQKSKKQHESEEEPQKTKKAKKPILKQKQVHEDDGNDIDDDINKFMKETSKPKAGKK